MFCLIALTVLASVTFLEAAPSCSANQVAVCLAPVVNFATNDGTRIAEMYQENPFAVLTGDMLTNNCRSTGEFMTCMISFVDRCNIVEMNTVADLFRSAVKLTDKCSSPTFGAKAQKYGACIQRLRQVNLEVSSCHAEIVKFIQPPRRDQSTAAQIAGWGEKRRTACCQQQKFHSCTAGPIQDICGNEVAETARQLNGAVIAAFNCPTDGSACESTL